MHTRISGTTQVVQSLSTAKSTGLLDASRVRIATTAAAYVKIGTATKATGSIVFTGQPVANETVTVNGTVVTFKNSGAVGNQVNIAGSFAATATALRTFLAASSDTNIDDCTYTDNGAGTITVTAVAYGVDGNAITLAESATNVAVSGSTLSGGGPLATTSDYLMGASSVETFLTEDSAPGVGVLRVTADGTVSVTPVH